AGCNGNNGNFVRRQCNPPNGVQSVLVYPAPNSTGVPDNFSVVVLGSTATLPSGFQAFIVNESTQNSGTFNFVGPAPSPLPTPNLLPTFANPVFQSSGNPGVSFVAGSTISVFLNNAN